MQSKTFETWCDKIGKYHRVYYQWEGKEYYENKDFGREVEVYKQQNKSFVTSGRRKFIKLSDTQITEINKQRLNTNMPKIEVKHETFKSV